MSFLRSKKVNGQKYCYLVENKHTVNGSRQKVKKYLGKVVRLEKKSGEFRFNLDGSDKREIIGLLVKWELGRHGFKLDAGVYDNEGVVFDPKNFKTNCGRKAVTLGINEGFLCDFTLRRLLRFKNSGDFQKDAVKLAKYFVEAGIEVPQEVFVEYYKKC